RIRQVKRDSDDRLAPRASPLVGQIKLRAKFRQPLCVQFTAKLLDETLDRRPAEFKAQLADWPTQKFLVRGFRFRYIVHRRSLTNILKPREHTRGGTVSL